MQYRRAFVLGGTFFFTLITCNRQKIFTEENEVSVLREAFRYVLKRHPFRIEAFVLLPDHLHTIWTLPDGDSNYPMCWSLIKSHFTRNWDRKLGVTNPSRKNKGEQSVWQRRYWEHNIRNEDDFIQHVEYIHYNPVKHGLIDAPIDWKYSSFHTFIRRGDYSPDWGAGNMNLNEKIGME